METYPVYITRYRHTAGLLGIFGGTLGLHNFYLGNKDRALTQLLITCIGSLFFGLGPFVSMIWGLIEGVQILSGTITTDGQGYAIANPDFAAQKSKSKILAGVLGLFLGAYGVHNFYLGNTGKAVAQLLLTVVGSLVGIGPIIAWIWALIESVQILSGTVSVDAYGKAIIDPARTTGSPNKSKVAAGLLGSTLGTFGAHNFYLGNTGKAVAQLLLGTVGCLLIVGPIISYIWGLIEGIQILSGKITVDAHNHTLIPD